jgi:hypothetical protein
MSGRWGVRATRVPRGYMERRQGWLAGKEIDQLNGEWSYNIVTLRTSRFHLQPNYVYYEPFWNVDSLSTGIWLSGVVNESLARPVAFATVSFETFESIYDAPSGVLPFPNDEESYVGSHTVGLVGFSTPMKVFKFRNAWGPGWGDEGYGSVSHDYLAEYGWDSFFSWNAYGHEHGYGPPLGAIEDMYAVISGGEGAYSDSVVKHLWLTRGEHGVQRGVGPSRKYDVRCHRIGSITSGCDVTTADIWLGNRLVGWCFAAQRVEKESGDRVLQFTEFYIWPPFRNSGAARTLFNSCLKFCDAWNPTRLEVLLHTVDRTSTDQSKLEAAAGCDIIYGNGSWPPIYGILQVSTA